MEIGPIFRAMLRNKAGFVLIGLQIAVTMAIMVNAVAIIQERTGLMARPSGTDEANVFHLQSLAFDPDTDLALETADHLITNQRGRYPLHIHQAGVGESEHTEHGVIGPCPITGESICACVLQARSARWRCPVQRRRRTIRARLWHGSARPLSGHRKPSVRSQRLKENINTSARPMR